MMQTKMHLIALCVLLGLAGIAFGLGLSVLQSSVLLVLGAMMLIVLRERHLARAIRRLHQATAGIANGCDLPSLGTQILQMQNTIDSLRNDLSQKNLVLRQGEEALHEAQERYIVAVSGAEDGLWDWDLRTKHVYYSPRWKTLFGLDLDASMVGIEAWLARVHPDDRLHVQRLLDEHLEGKQAQLACEHRVQHAAGHWVWVLVRGRVICSASGKPVRLVTLTTDISPRKRAEEILFCLAAGLNSLHGHAFFQNLVFNFAQALGVQQAFITECLDQNVHRVRTLAYWDGVNFVGPLEYDLPGTPCDIVINQSQTCFYPTGLGTLFPRDAGFESYLGIPILDAAQRVIGHLALLDKLPMNDPLPHEPIFKLFASRAGVELELEQLRRKAL
jgi:PAS domain S-box-containing protein